MEKYPIKTTGILCKSDVLVIGWPELPEFDLITSLRNQPYVRKWFMNDEPINIGRNRTWLETGMNRPYEALLAIRLSEDNTFLGTIGWSDWDPVSKTAWFGRLAVDLRALRKTARQIPDNYAGVALDATQTLRDYAFQHMELDRILTYYMSGNQFAARVNKSVGMVESGCRTRIRKDNTPVETVELELTRQRWIELRSAAETRKDQDQGIRV